MSSRNERAVAVDGTAIEFARMKLGKHGVELQERAPSGKQSGQKGKKGQQSRKGKQSRKGQQSSGGGGSKEQDEEVVVVFNDDVPPEEREEVREEIENLETKSSHAATGESQGSESSPSGGKQGESGGGKQGQSGGGKQKQSGGQSRGSYRTVGFVPYDRLMYVVPENLTYDVRA